MTATLGVVGAAMFVGVHLLAGRSPVWVYGFGITSETAVSMADKTVILGFCLVLIVASRWQGVRTWGRLLLAAIIVASGLAIVLDDVAQNDFSFTTAWLVLVQLVAIGTVPYTPRQALGIAGALLGVYLWMLSVYPDAIAPDLIVHRLAYFLFAIVIVVTLSSYLYAARYGQHEALEQVRRLKDELAVRSEALEVSFRDLRQTQAALLSHERFAALGKVTAGVAHEIQNPLNFVVNFAGLNRGLVDDLRGALAEPDALERRALADELLDELALNAEAVEGHGRRAARVVRRMLEHSRATTARVVSVDVNRFVEETLCAAVRHVHARLGAEAVEGPAAVRVERVYDADAGAVEVDVHEMSVALLNLLDNAFRAALEAGHARPRIAVATRAVEEGVEIEVSDNGAGIPGTVRERLFEPFVTTRPAGEGAGLGLSLAYDTVTNRHGGSLAVRSHEGEGASFLLQIPRPAA